MIKIKLIFVNDLAMFLLNSHYMIKKHIYHYLSALPQWLRFGIVGAIGFVIDTGLLSLCFNVFGLGALLGRVPGFVLSVLATWYLNSCFTFKQAQMLKLKNFMHYFLSNIVGMSINWSIYTLCLYSHPIFLVYPFLAVIPASGTAMFFNYNMAKFVLFVKRDF